MNSTRTRNPIFIAFLLLSILLSLPTQRGRALDIQNRFPHPPHLEPTASDTPNDSRVRPTSTDTSFPLNPNVLSASLGPGNDLVHGLIFYNGFLWASTRTNPARILKIDPANLAVSNQFVLGNGQDEADDITASPLYVWAILYTDPAQLIKVDPSSSNQPTAYPFPTGLAFGESLKYAFGYLWAGVLNHLVKIDVSDPNAPAFTAYDFSSLKTQDYTVLTAITYSNDHLWGVFTQYALLPSAHPVSTTIAKIDPANPTLAASKTMNVSSLFPDDITYAGTHFFASSENPPVQTTHSDLYEFDDNLTTSTSKPVSGSASYGTAINPVIPTTFWGAYVASPGKLLKFDLNSPIIKTLNLPVGFDDPSEIAFDNVGNMYVTTWQTPAGIVKYLAQDTLLFQLHIPVLVRK